MIDFAVTPRNAPPPPPRRAGAGVLIWVLLLAGFLATGAGGVWLWQQQQEIATRLSSPPPASAPAAPLETKIGPLEQRLTQLEQRPLPAPLAPLEGQLGALDQRLAQLEQRPAPAVPVAVLASQLGTLEQRLLQLEQRPAPAAPPPPVSAATEAAITALELRVTQLEQRPAAAVAADGQPSAAGPDSLGSLANRLQTLEQRLGLAEQVIRTGAARAARLHAASMALEAGKPLGDIPGAPPALARFAIVAPPTEASLRLSFPAAASAASQAGEPASATGLSLPWRMWQQIQTLVSIRQGDAVLVGVPASHVLAQAQALLDAGDLAGAVAALDGLDATAAKAIAGWRDQAQSLLDARAALAGLGHP